MIVNIEFLDKDPIENVITCLNYKVDKVIFFGSEDEISEKKESTDRFLKRYCSVKETEFYPLSKTNLEEILFAMDKVVETERTAGNQVFFDVTGGEGLMLVAFGILSREKNLPMHMFDAAKGWMYELNREVKPTMSEAVSKHKVELNIERYIEMHGGVVNHSMQKDTKSLEDPEFTKDADRLWNICSKYQKTWNVFSEFLREYCQPDANLYVVLDIPAVTAEIKKKRKFGKKEIKEIFKSCVGIGVFEDMYNTGDTCSFSYKSARIKEILWDAGSVLELHTYMEERKNATDCKVGVHIDWDGTIYGGWGKDTVNEIDVLTLNGYIPTFISCKNGNVDQMDLYELDAVATRFGGKYAKKVLMAPQGMNKAHRKRAEEMGIEIQGDR
ncbi:MAG: hypothetical protein IJP00_01085 [Firmicutes bacterium]|nr:hypothetical protein [Bacillota bacterium]